MNTRKFLSIVAALMREDGFHPSEADEPTWKRALYHSKFGGLKVSPTDWSTADEALEFFKHRIPLAERGKFLKVLMTLAQRGALNPNHMKTAAWIIPTYFDRSNVPTKLP